MEHSRAQTSGKVPTVSQNAGIIPLENGDSVNKNAQVCAQGFAQSCRLTNKRTWAKTVVYCGMMNVLDLPDTWNIHEV